MSRRRGPLMERVEAFSLKVLLLALRYVPTRLCVGVLRVLGFLAFHVVRGRREIGRRSVKLALGLEGREADRVVAGAFRTLALNVGESILVQRKLARMDLEDFITVVGGEHIAAADAKGKGVLLAGAHYGCWEASAVAISRHVRRVWAVGRPLDNPHLAKLVTELREQPLAGTLEKEGSGRELVRLFRKGEIVGLLLDQNAGRQGMMLDFFGRPTMQHKVSGVMSTRFGVPVVPVYMTREPGHLRFRLEFEPAIEANPSLSEEDAIQDVMRRVSESLEARIRAQPDQWLWLHDRWRKAQWLLDRQARQAARAEAAEAASGETGGSEAVGGSEAGGAPEAPAAEGAQASAAQPA